MDRRNDERLPKLTPDALKKLTEKLSEMMGEDVTQSFEQVKNERGELLNEEGLPIIDITEPLATAAERGTGNALLAEEAPLPSLSNLPDPIKERLRQQRDRILDELEEEERAQQKREEQADLEERQEILRKRREAAANEKEKLKLAKEMQKKMGQALLRNMSKEGAPGEELQVAEAISEDAKPSSLDEKPTKKTVAFADDPGSSEAKEESLDWGDIAPGRLRSTGRPSLLSSSDKLTMKMTVVERTPSAPPKTTAVDAPDSDDESDPDSPDDGEDLLDDAGNVSDLDQEPTFEEEEIDLDFAQHQREIALQYHEKRNKIGAAALAAMASHSHVAGGDVRVDIPSDLPSSEPEKPPISRFKAAHFASSYNAATSPSTSLGASVIPASTVQTLQKAIRTGNLNADEKLVGGDADSASEDENEGMQELLELLQKGELYNLGPDGNLIHAVPPSAGKGQPASVSTPSSSTVTGKAPFNDLPPIDRPKTSKFKLSRANAGRPSGSSLPLDQSVKTGIPVSMVDRSSPKPNTTMTSNVLERSSAQRPSTRTTPVLERSSPKPASATTPAVLERRPASTVNPTATTPAFPSTIVDSPSFPASAAARMSSQTGTTPAFSMTVDSPSFPKPQVPVAPSGSSRPSRPPTLVSSAVRESSRASPGNTTPDLPQARPGKVSRFMAERET